MDAGPDAPKYEHLLITAQGVEIGDGTPTVANTDPQMPANWTE